MTLDWSKPLFTRDGRYGHLLPPDGLTTKRRVVIARKGNRFTALVDAKDYTTWHCEDDGTLTFADASWALENR